jgi:co-chaperonin GroES (HSP10)
MSYIPLNDKIIVERLEGSRETSSGIILKSSGEPDRAKVITVADNLDEVSINDELLVNWNGAVKLEEDIYSIDIEHVVAVYE